MAYKDSKFLVLDNTGVKLVKCLSILKDRKCKPGSIVTIVIKRVLPKRKLQKGQICKAVIVCLNGIQHRYNGYVLKRQQTSVVLLKKTENVPLGTRIEGVLFFELRLKGFLRVVALSLYTI